LAAQANIAGLVIGAKCAMALLRERAYDRIVEAIDWRRRVIPFLRAHRA